MNPLYAERLGHAGPPMAFIHPIPMDSSCWVYQMAHFSTWFRTIGIDVPGWGRSPAAPGVTMAAGADACWRAIEEVSDEPAVVCGVSVGCHLAIHMAVRRPEKTRALILSGCGFPEREALEALNKRYDFRAKSYGEEWPGVRYGHVLYDFSPEFREGPLARYFADVITERNDMGDQQTMVDWFYALQEPDPVDAVVAPTLILIGSQDGSYPHAPALQQRIKGSELVILEGAGHACNMEKPWEWDQHALRFLRQQGILSA